MKLTLVQTFRYLQYLIKYINFSPLKDNELLSYTYTYETNSWFNFTLLTVCDKIDKFQFTERQRVYIHEKKSFTMFSFSGGNW